MSPAYISIISSINNSDDQSLDMPTPTQHNISKQSSHMICLKASRTSTSSHWYNILNINHPYFHILILTCLFHNSGTLLQITSTFQYYSCLCVSHIYYNWDCLSPSYSDGSPHCQIIARYLHNIGKSSLHLLNNSQLCNL